MKTVKEAAAKISELETRIVELEQKLANVKVRDRGPASTRTMTEDDAKKIMLGELKEKSHKECANILGLSYGQVYSARNGFTFKNVYKEAEKTVKK
jgi:DNA-directed RNA polymerase specialized sigma24 family protein